jgi:hypothetical protein
VLKTYWKAKNKKKKNGEGFLGTESWLLKKRQNLVKLVIKGLFLILFHAWGSDLASELLLKGVCLQRLVAQSLKCS